eukprot:CAMPEP_0172326338 /NCGR_PEP_ID=MMETSP1058-20130122/56221_1 /TAXON_ID=83371 /ORGANISM="Detonula confervacea, Strain CCMP 353" /LENGTH=202 /DNA_ID=CAMNT_0013043095 /DNA_START=10 /DNA_END=615 /DNA_ORIENTATION=-
MTSPNHRRTKWALLALFCSLTASVVVNFVSMFLEPFDSEFGYTVEQKQLDLYIPGAGFSGFFYTLGRLQAFLHSPHNATHEYYCFSAGCLALIASLLNLQIDDVLELAHSSRNQWNTGEISRYDVVEHFVDGLLQNIEDEMLLVGEKLLNTTLFDGREEECDNYQANAIQGAKMDAMQYPLMRNARNLHASLPRINVITTAW